VTGGQPSSPDGGREDVADLEALARWMDSVFQLPGVGVRLGLDALLGLLPGVGDTATSLVSLYILQRASRYGVSKITMTRMALNLTLDLLIGALPIVGDLFDVFWKANRRNISLLQRHLRATPAEARRLRAGDRAFVWALAAAVVLALVGSVALAYYIAAWLISALGRLL
jgi:hypothetical protein